MAARVSPDAAAGQLARLIDTVPERNGRLRREIARAHAALSGPPRCLVAAVRDSDAWQVLDFLLGGLKVLGPLNLNGRQMVFRHGEVPGLREAPSGPRTGGAAETLQAVLPSPVLKQATLTLSTGPAYEQNPLARLHAAILAADATIWVSPAGIPWGGLEKRLWAAMPVQLRDRGVLVVTHPGPAADMAARQVLEAKQGEVGGLFRLAVPVFIDEARRAAPAGGIADAELFRASGAEALIRGVQQMLRDIRADAQMAAEALLRRLAAERTPPRPPRPAPVARATTRPLSPVRPEAEPAAVPVTPVRQTEPPAPVPAEPPAPAAPEDAAPPVRRMLAEAAERCLVLVDQGRTDPGPELFRLIARTLQDLGARAATAEPAGADGREFWRAIDEAQELAALLAFEGGALAVSTATALLQQIGLEFLARHDAAAGDEITQNRAD